VAVDDLENTQFVGETVQMTRSTAVIPGYFPLPWDQITGTNSSAAGNFEDAVAELSELVLGSQKEQPSMGGPVKVSLESTY
jgi:hypothetical protein